MITACFFTGVSAQAKNIDNNIYRVCKNDIFTDFGQLNCKKIVTELKNDGSFAAMDLGKWIKENHIFDISVVEESDNLSLKKMYYERNPEKEKNDEFYDTDDTSYIYFDGLVQEGDVISYTDSLIETVTKVEFDGSFYTQVDEQASSLLK